MSIHSLPHKAAPLYDENNHGRTEKNTMTGSGPKKTGQQTDFDLIIIGGGIAGGMLAAAMARNGVRTLVLEGGVHPKFAIGESMILETSEIMRSLAMIFDVPELETFSSEYFMPVAGTTHGVKRHFSFLPHQEDQEPNAQNLVQAVIPKHPYGHELHLYRQDTDYYYLSVAMKYGAVVNQNVKVTQVDIGEKQTLITTDTNKQYSADYVVDAGGHNSIIAMANDLREKDGLLTHTRSIFTHMVDVSSYHEQGPTANELGVPFSLSEGTHHHVFEGGWMWVIPFNNHSQASNNLCSVGLLLDPRIHPIREDLTPEEEFNAFLSRYPAMERHLKGAKSVRNWIRTGRIQYTSKECVGDRFTLLGHAAGFIDPLFSKGLYSSLASVLTFGRLFLSARKTGDYSREKFLPLERLSNNFTRNNDRLVANSIKSFAKPELWRQYSVMWLTGAYLELVKLTTMRQAMKKTLNKPGKTYEGLWEEEIPNLKLIGGCYADYENLFDDISTQIEQLDMNENAAIDYALQDISEKIAASSWIPASHRNIAAGARHLPSNKYNLKLFTRKGGLLGEKPYRDHFFGDTNSVDLALFLAKDIVKYSKPAINTRHKRQMQSAL